MRRHCVSVGFVAGGWFLGVRFVQTQPKRKPPEKIDRGDRLAAERAVMATGRLVDLANCMATDVNDHSAVVGAITAELRSIVGDSSLDSVVLSALDQIVTANGDLQLHWPTRKSRSQLKRQKSAAKNPRPAPIR